MTHTAVPCLAPTVTDGGRPCRRRVIKLHERDRCPIHRGRYVPVIVAEFFGGKSMMRVAASHGMGVGQVEEAVMAWARGLVQ